MEQENVVVNRWDEQENITDGGTYTCISVFGYSEGFQGDDSTTIEVWGADLSDEGTVSPGILKKEHKYLVKRVVSPFEFYLKMIPDSQVIVDSNEDQERMQKHYDAVELNSVKFKINVVIMKCYAWRDPLSLTWHRVRVHALETDGKINRALAYFCDSGKQDYIFCEELRQLEIEYRGVGRFPLIKCYLYDVLPISGEIVWSLDAISFFKELLEDSFCRAAVMQWSKGKAASYTSLAVNNCGVALFLDDSVTEEFTVNYLMVKKGYAESIGIMSVPSSPLEIAGKVPHFEYDPVLHNHEPESSCPPLDGTVTLEQLHNITTLFMATHGYPSKAFCRVCFYDAHNGIENNDVNYIENCLPYSVKCRVGWMKITHMEGPEEIYIQLRKERMELREMEWELAKEATKMDDTELEKIKPGLYVACEVSTMPYPESPRRGFVLDFCKGSVKVLLVDYGSSCWLENTFIYNLPERFHSLPSFVHRVHLRTVRPKLNSSWDSELCQKFSHYVLAYNEQYPIYYIQTPPLGKPVRVELSIFKQKLLFDEGENEWVPGSQSTLNWSDSANLGSLISLMKDDPMLAPYYTSFGVDIVFELWVEENEVAKFEHLADYLVEQKQASMIEGLFDKDKLHQVITQGFDDI